MVLEGTSSMRIGALARKTGLSRDTIRFYERQGLIASYPSREVSNAYRDYPEELVERLAMIVRAREAGFSVADLVLLLRFMEGNPEADGFTAEEFIAEKIGQLRHVIAEAQKLAGMLEATRKALAGGPVEWREG